MKTVKSAKIAKTTGLILAVILLLGVCVFLFLKPVYYRILYPWDRITGTIHLTADGESREIGKSDITCLYDAKDTAVSARPGQNGTKISIHAGEYGPYSILLHVEGIEKPVEIVVYQYNWWNVCSFDLEITVDSEANTISLCSTATVLDEHGKKIPVTESATLNCGDEELKFYIVSI